MSEAGGRWSWSNERVRRWRAAIAGVFVGRMAVRATPERLPAAPLAATMAVAPLGIPNARFLPGDIEGLTAEYAASIERERAESLRAGRGPALGPSASLAISGGGDGGAYGAGILVGWTARGDRPSFKVVTGVSTGALSAPFAFLGPAYDDRLRTVYTTTGPSDVFVERSLLALLFDDAMNDTRPLMETMRLYLDEATVAAIGAEYLKGRLLFAMSTNLDSGMPILWNVGAIAASGKPGARELILRIMLASAAIPGVFPPVMFDAIVDGEAHQEMHVDGGVVAQAFLYPPKFDLRAASAAAGADRPREGYVIRNGRLMGDMAKVDRLTLSVIQRSVAVMISSSGMNDLYRMYTQAARDGMGFNLTYIGRDFVEPYRGPFDTAYMNALFAFGVEKGRSGAAWSKVPPGWIE